MTLFDLTDLNDTERGDHLHRVDELPSPHTESATRDIGSMRPTTGPPEPLPAIEVRVSARRRKTSEARWVGDRIIVSLPAHLDVESRQKTTDWLVERLLTRHRLQAVLGDDELLGRAVELSNRYLIGTRPASVRWVTNQTARWASCSYYSGDIRVSHRLRSVPDWVLDSVLVHEVAHLTYPDHSPEFHRLAGGYPRHEEAGIFLAGYGLGLAKAAPS